MVSSLSLEVYSRSDTSQRCGERTPILIRSCNGLSESVPHPMSPNYPLLVFPGLCGVIPRTQLKSYFLHQATCLLQPPLPHSSSPCGLLGGGAGRKRVLQESCSVRAGSLKALASSKDRNWRRAYIRSTCAQQGPEVEPAETGLELHMDMSTLGPSSPSPRPAQGL